MKILTKDFWAVKSWRTTTLGILAILFAIILAAMIYVPNQTLKFNVLYVWQPCYPIMFLGWMAIHARDHRCK